MPAAKVFLSVYSVSLSVSVWVALDVGCKTAPPPDPDMTAILQTLTYDTTFPPITAVPPVTPMDDSVQPPQTQASVPRKTVSTPAKSEKPFLGNIRDGLRTAGALVMLGTINIFEAILGFDDEPADSSPRGQADQNLKHWLDDRDRWLRESR
jgi:hypothetical protein